LKNQEKKIASLESGSSASKLTKPSLTSMSSKVSESLKTKVGSKVGEGSTRPQTAVPSKVG
jgi:hypothetical protein